MGAGRECRYSRARRGIGSTRGHWGLLESVGGVGAIRGVSGGVGHVRDVLGASRECSTQAPEVV